MIKKVFSLSSDELKKLFGNEIIFFENIFYFKSEDEKNNFLEKFNILKEKNITIKYINQDIVNFLNNLEFNEDNLKKLKVINWTEFNSIFENKNPTKRTKKIYEKFIDFLKKEFNLNDELKKEKKDLNEIFLGKSFDLNIFKKKKDFDIEKDLVEKILRYDIEVTFDYKKKPDKINVEDFVFHFNKRLEYFFNLMKNRINVDNLTKIKRLKDLRGTNLEVSIVGLVSEITQTKNGHYIINLEDNTGIIKCFVNKNNIELIKIIEELTLDEVITINGKVGNDIIWIDEIITPQPPTNFEENKLSEDGYFVVFSDTHFSGKLFSDESFQKFLDWINGNTSNEKLNELSKKIKYIIIAGDVIEGIGIYPGQGADARILSAELQYHEAARWLSQIPENILVIIIPGNHDTTRLSEPQPKMSYEESYPLYNLKNVIILSNPARVKIFTKDKSGGLDIFIYHGGSLFYFADKIKKLREIDAASNHPEKVVEFLLNKRHLAPTHGSTLYYPDKDDDYLIIKKLPDYFIVGHTHKLTYSNYKGCKILSGGTWAKMSFYQEKRGLIPDVGKVFLINGKTNKIKKLNFFTE